MRTARRPGESRRIGIVTAAATLAVVVVPLAYGATPSSAPDAVSYVTDGPVHAIERAGGRTFIGGEFEHVGPRVGSGVELTQAGGGIAPGPSPGDPAFPEVAGGEVRAVVPDGHGGWYIGGDFTHVGGQSFPRLAHISGGQLDGSWNPAPNGTVRALAIGKTESPSSSTLYVGGSYSIIGGDGRANLAAFKLDPAAGSPVSPGGGLPSRVPADWKPEPSNTVHALATVRVDDVEVTPPGGSMTATDMTIVIAGGEFLDLTTNANADRVAAIWGLGATDEVGAAISPLVATAEVAFGGTVRALAAGPPVTSGGGTFAAVYAGGDFTTPKNQVAALRLQVTRADPNAASTGLATYTNWTFTAASLGATATIRSLALSPVSADQQTLYAGGEFTGSIGQTTVGARTNLAAVKAVPSTAAVVSQTNCGGTTNCPATAEPWSPQPDGAVDALARAGDAVFAGGRFTTLGDGVAAIDASSGIAMPSWDPRPAGGATNALATQGSNVYAGGGFESVGATPVRNLAAIGADGALDTAWLPNPNDRVESLAAEGSTLYVGGQFTQIAGGAPAHLGVLDQATGSSVPGFAPAIACLDNGNPCTAKASVFAIEPVGSTVYIGGAFTHVGGEERRGIAAVGPVGTDSAGTPTGWDPDASGPPGGPATAMAHVHDIEASCETVYAAGNFSRIGSGQPLRSRLAALDPSNADATPWDPNPNSTVFDLALRGATVYAAGNFSAIGSASGRAARQRLAAVHGDAVGDGTGPIISGWNPGADGTAQAIEFSGDGNTLNVGGEFNQLGGVARSGLGSVDAVAVGDGSGDATSWNPSPGGGFAGSRETRAIATAGDSVYAGGEFTHVGASAQSGFSPHTLGPETTESQLDCSLPTVTITSGPDSPTAATAATFEFLASDPTAELECSLDGAQFAPCASPTQYSGLSNGQHSFAARARRPGSRFVGPETTAAWLIDPNAGETDDPKDGCRPEILGTDRKDRLRGTKREDHIHALGGSDTVSGKGSDDCIDAGAGRDRVETGEGADRALGGGGSDALAGEKGDDMLTGGGKADRLAGGAGDDVLDGEGGEGDSISGGSGRDRLLAVDGERDFVKCGRGRDKAVVDRVDKVTGCERVRRVKPELDRRG